MQTTFIPYAVAILLSLIPAALAVYRITKFFIDDYLFEKPRDAIFNKFPPETSKIGYLFTCYWCMSMWVATLVTIGFILVPSAMLIVCFPFAISAIVGKLSER
jgi:hypothetical protein